VKGGRGKHQTRCGIYLTQCPFLVGFVVAVQAFLTLARDIKNKMDKKNVSSIQINEIK